MVLLVVPLHDAVGTKDHQRDEEQPGKYSLRRPLQGVRTPLRSPRSHGTSHAVFRTPWPGDPRVNIQNDHGKAKEYQVRQGLLAIAQLEIDSGDET